MSELRAPSEWLVLRMARSVCAAHAWARRANLIKNLSLAAPSNLSRRPRPLPLYAWAWHEFSCETHLTK